MATAAAATMAAMPMPRVRRRVPALRAFVIGVGGGAGFMAMTGARSSGGGASSSEAAIRSHSPGGGLPHPGVRRPATSRCSATSARHAWHP